MSAGDKWRFIAIGRGGGEPITNVRPSIHPSVLTYWSNAIIRWTVNLVWHNAAICMLKFCCRLRHSHLLIFTTQDFCQRWKSTGVGGVWHIFPSIFLSVGHKSAWLLRQLPFNIWCYLVSSFHRFPLIKVTFDLLWNVCVVPLQDILYQVNKTRSAVVAVKILPEQETPRHQYPS